MSPQNGHSQQEHSSEELRTRLDLECQTLTAKLQSIRNKRKEVKRLVDEGTAKQIHKLLEMQNTAIQNRQTAFQEYQSAIFAKNQSFKWLDLAQNWNVTNDCFFIWHRGPFVTINGLRLGSEVPALPSTPTIDNTDILVKANGSHSTYANYTKTTENIPQNGNYHHPAPQVNDGFKVPWVETNSALGITALLLSTMEQKANSGIRYQHEILPMGSTSKIGLRSGSSVTYHNLYSDDNFQFFGKRNFNAALTGLLQCVKDAAEAVEKIDRTIAIPHAIEKTSKGEMIVGGLPIAYGADGEQWTRSMKYMLTDIKWLVAYTTKHVDRQ